MDERIVVRQRYHCAPLTTDGFTSLRENGTHYVQYHYSQGLLHIDAVNYTLMVPSVDSQYASTKTNLRTSGSYLLRCVHFHSFRISCRLCWTLGLRNTLFPEISSVFRVTTYKRTFVDQRSDFKPIPSLHRPDGGLSLLFLVGNGVKFAGPVDDDWYRATARDPGDIHGDGAIPSEALSVCSISRIRMQSFPIQVLIISPGIGSYGLHPPWRPWRDSQVKFSFTPVRGSFCPSSG